MPELVNMSVGSLPGTSGLDATTVWPLEAKKSRKVLRMSATEAGRVMSVVLRAGSEQLYIIARPGVRGAERARRPAHALRAWGAPPSGNCSETPATRRLCARPDPPPDAARCGPAVGLRCGHPRSEE